MHKGAQHKSAVEVVVCGSIGLDDITTPFGAVREALGGSAGYSAVAASYFAKPGIVSIAGTDFPAKYRTLLEDRGINLAGVAVSGKNFRWQGAYEFDMAEAKTLGTELNSLAELKPDLPADYQSAPVLLLANADPEIQLRLAKQMPSALVVLDTMNFWISSKRAELVTAIGQADILVLNDAEARQLCNQVNLVKAAKQLRAMGPEYVIIKKGEHGALLFGHETCFTAPGYPLEALKDPTGAGDSFAGALSGYLATQTDRGEPTIRKAVVYGSTLASFCTEDFSVNRTANLTKSDIEERYHAFKTLSEF